MKRGENEIIIFFLLTLVWFSGNNHLKQELVSTHRKVLLHQPFPGWPPLDVLHFNSYQPQTWEIKVFFFSFIPLLEKDNGLFERCESTAELSDLFLLQMPKPIVAFVRTDPAVRTREKTQCSWHFNKRPPNLHFSKQCKNQNTTILRKSALARIS